MSSERNYIQLCKREIERQLSLNIDGSSLKSRDFEYLSGKIKEKSGITLSLSTLKRLWKDDFSQIPQPATLNALVSLLNYNDWQEFKQKNSIIEDGRNDKINYSKIILFAFSLIIILILILIAILVFKKDKVTKPAIKGKIYFSADKTIALGVPNTVVFKYDVSNVKADSFFIQQSWNERYKERIDPHNNVFSSIYHVPGFHRAKLIANNTIIAKQNVHILSNGWMPYINYNVNDLLPIYLNLNNCISEGQFKIKKSDLQKSGIEINKNFTLRLNNSRDFGVMSDNFSVKTKFKCDSIKAAVCPHLEIMIVFEGDIYWISLVKKGCEFYASYKIGEKYADGKNKDLSLLGCDIYQWQNLEITIHNKKAEVMLNGKSVLHLNYVQDFGKLVGIIYTFDGLGSVDFISVSDANGKTVYQDDFN